ncbi:hypothetical protein MBLNU457_5605t1 [Dothideomycetes sp. NU457]
MSQPPSLPPIQGQNSPAQIPQYQQPPPPQQHPAHPQYAPPTSNGAQIQQLGTQFTPANAYVYPHPAPTQGSIPPNGLMNGQSQIQYTQPLQSTDSRSLSGERQKKEIKRRTKTGCLTCRKRRIKCDESHPTCKNCAKSKRECMGYDPIFKASLPPSSVPAQVLAQQQQQREQQEAQQQQQRDQQQQQQQPQQPRASSISSSSATPVSYAPAMQGYAPAVSAGHAPTPPPAPPVFHSVNSEYRYGAASESSLPTEPPPPPPPPLPEHNILRTYSTTLLPRRFVKQLSIDEIFLHDHVPPNVYPPVEEPSHYSEQDLAEMRTMYKQQYAPGLDSFFETTWYSMQGEFHIQANNLISQFLKYCVDRFKDPPQQQQKYETLPSLEARLVWFLATIPRFAPTITSDEQLVELLPRITTIEHLLTGTFLPESDIPTSPTQAIPPPDTPAYATHLSASFWHHLGTFTSINDSTTSTSSISAQLTAISQALSSMRAILSMLENRDVLYSMAIARHYGGRAAEYKPDDVLIPSSQDPEDPFQKLLVAMRFLTGQESAGTTQIVQRFCGMARRSWSRGRGDRYKDVADVTINGSSVKVEDEPKPEASSELTNDASGKQPTAIKEEKNSPLPPAAQKQDPPSQEPAPHDQNTWSKHAEYGNSRNTGKDLPEGVRALQPKSAEHNRPDTALPNGIESN